MEPEATLPTASRRCRTILLWRVSGDGEAAVLHDRVDLDPLRASRVCQRVESTRASGLKAGQDGPTFFLSLPSFRSIQPAQVDLDANSDGASRRYRTVPEHGGRLLLPRRRIPRPITTCSPTGRGRRGFGPRSLHDLLVNSSISAGLARERWPRTGHVTASILCASARSLMILATPCGHMVSRRGRRRRM